MTSTTSKEQRIADAKQGISPGPEPCTECMKPHTKTFVMVEGSDVWQVGVLAELGLELEEAERTLRVAFESAVVEKANGRPIIVTADNVLVGPQIDMRKMNIRLCRECAKSRGWTAAVVGRPCSGLIEPEGEVKS